MTSVNLIELMAQQNFYFWENFLKTKKMSSNMITILEDNITTTKELEQVQIALLSSMDENLIQYFADSRYNAQQMKQIRLGLTHTAKERRALVKLYCNPRFSAEQMEQIRLGIENGLNIPQLKDFANENLNTTSMKERRETFEKTNQKAILRSLLKKLKGNEGD